MVHVTLQWCSQKPSPSNNSRGRQVRVYLGWECLAAYQQESLLKESLGLPPQPKLQPFCSPPALPSRASTTGRSRAQTPAPATQSSASKYLRHRHFSTRSSVATCLLSDERHDTNAGEHVLPRQALTWDSVRKGLGSIGSRLAQVTHEKRHVGPENKREVTDCEWDCTHGQNTTMLLKIAMATREGLIYYRTPFFFYFKYS